jgi:aminoglycoside 6'-N-acetyltransferase
VDRPRDPSGHPKGSQLSFLPLRRDDFSLLSKWFSLPHVQTWWREDAALGAIASRYGPSVDGTDPTECFIVQRCGVPIGFAQRYRLVDNLSWQKSLAESGCPADSAGIDYLIGELEWIGRGVGPQLIAQLTEMVLRDLSDASAVVASVQKQNKRSWRALEKSSYMRIWSGWIVSDDPSDEGESHVYIYRRPPTVVADAI